MSKYFSKFFPTLLLLATLFLTSCASMFSGTTQQITVTSEIKGTKIYLNDEYLGSDSVTTRISKKKLSDSIFRVKKDGCTDTTRSIETKIDATSFLGCLLDFCTISVLLTDTLITGAVREAEKTSYILNPNCSREVSSK